MNLAASCKQEREESGAHAEHASRTSAPHCRPQDYDRPRLDCSARLSCSILISECRERYQIKSSRIARFRPPPPILDLDRRAPRGRDLSLRSPTNVQLRSAGEAPAEAAVGPQAALRTAAGRRAAALHGEFRSLQTRA